MISKSLAFAAAMLAIAAPAWAAPAAPPGCGAGDLSGVSFISCVGYSTGNAISGNAADMALAGGVLTGLGLSGTAGTWIEKIEGLNGSTTINFATPLYGITYFGIHRGGAGNGGQGTAFYKIDAGSGLDFFSYNLGGSSNAALYAVTATAVPEPESYLMLLAGVAGVVGSVGFVRRRRV